MNYNPSFVDLGLPSGLMWADTNLGAKSPNDTGLYLTFDDAQSIVELFDNYHLPTIEDFQELIDNTNYLWLSAENNNGVAGGLFTSKINGESIFLPAAGCRYDGSLNNAGSYGYYWSSSLDAFDARYGQYLYFSSISHGTNDYYRYDGRSIRPVMKKQL